MEIKILGTGCPNCNKLEMTTKYVVNLLGLDATIVKVTDMAEVMAYGVMSMPGFVIDGEVISSGKMYSLDEMKELLSKYKKEFTK